MKGKRIIIALIVSTALLASCKSNASAITAQEENATTVTENMNGISVLSDNTTSEGVRQISAKPQGVCSQQINVEVKDGVILKVTFVGGCPGNTQGVAKLVAGMKVTDAIAQLEGIDCAGKGTSCPDRLAKVLKLFL